MTKTLERPKVWRLEPPPHARSHWRGYAEVLLHGLTAWRAGDHVALHLERTGPYVPALTFPGDADIVVTDALRAVLAARVRELRFREVVKSHVVRLDWHLWDVAGLEPRFVPPSLDPVDYIVGAPHDEELAAEMGPLFEVVADVDPEVEAEDGAFHYEDYIGQPLVRADLHRGANFVSEEFRAALEEAAPGLAAFHPARRARRA